MGYLIEKMVVEHVHSGPPENDLEHGPGTIWECDGCGKEWILTQISSDREALEAESYWQGTDGVFGWFAHD